MCATTPRVMYSPICKIESETWEPVWNQKSKHHPAPGQAVFQKKQGLGKHSLTSAPPPTPASISLLPFLSLPYLSAFLKSIMEKWLLLSLLNPSPGLDFFFHSLQTSHCSPLHQTLSTTPFRADPSPSFLPPARFLVKDVIRMSLPCFGP